MNIVHIEDFFHPDAGYQCNILLKYMALEGHKVSLITSEMDKMPLYMTSFFGKNDIESKDKEFTKKTGVDIYRVPIFRYFSGRSIYKPRIKKLVTSLSPDVLYIHGNDSIIGILYTLRSKKLTFPIILDSHMLEMASKNPFKNLFRIFYKTFITPIIIKRKIQIIRIQDDDYIEKFLGIPLTLSPFISIGSDTLLFHPDEETRRNFRNENLINDNDFVILYAGKLDESKGGKLLAETFLKKIESKKNKNIILIIVGNIVSDEYGNVVRELFNKSENRILFFPTQKYIDLPKYFQSADLVVFPKQCSLSFFDAQACGVPVVSEDNNINTARLNVNNGFTFKSGDADDFRDKISFCIDMDDEKYSKMKFDSQSFVYKNYNYSDISREYMSVINKLASDYQKKTI